MAPSLKDRGSRLQAFARKTSDSAANHNVSASKSDTLIETRPETPLDPSHAPTRQELAAAVRLALPSDFRSGASHQQQNGHAPGHGRSTSPPHVSRASPTPRRTRDGADDHTHGLFSGSQLGGSFMNSGLSTPQNEPVEASDGESTPNAQVQVNRHHQAHASQSSGRAFWSAAQAAFRFGENLRLSVVPGTAPRGLPQMMDGFRDDAMPSNGQSYRLHRDYSSAAAPIQPRLPVREVRIKRLPAPSRKAILDEREAPSPSRSIESTRWPARRDLDDARHTALALDMGREPDSPSAPGRAPGMAAADKARDATRRLAGANQVPANIALHKLPRERKRRRGSPDYDDRMLNSMSFATLVEEPFDLDPAKATAQSSQDASATLPLKLEQYRQQGDREQRLMFGAMTLDDWEASGEWFVDQFADIMRRLRDARRSKRFMVQGFEDEAARREEAVRLRSETIDRKLVRMRQDGQRVVDKGP